MNRMAAFAFIFFLAFTVAACSTSIDSASLAIQTSVPPETSEPVLATGKVVVKNETPEECIASYYALANDSYFALEDRDFSAILDLQNIQNINKTAALRALNERWKYGDEKGYSDSSDRKPVQYHFQFDDMQVNDKDAVVSVTIVYDEIISAIPIFMGSGENIFTLVLTESGWKITGHDYVGIAEFEQSKDEVRSFNQPGWKEATDLDYAAQIDNS